MIDKCDLIMRVNLVSMLSLGIFFKTGASLICQKCNAVNFKECDTGILNISCPRYMDMCITMVTSYNIKKNSGTMVTRREVAKGCASSDYDCQSLCRVQPGHNCLIGCCYGNYCNRTPTMIRGYSGALSLSGPSIYTFLLMIFFVFIYSFTC